MSSVPLVAAVAAAGIIIGCIELTGLSGKFTLLLFELSGGALIPSLILAAAILVLLGMGMPTTGVYIMGVALLAPVLIGKFGLPLMPVHMFLLFYACMSAITPPVAVAAFAAAAVADANPFKLAPYACKLAVGGFLLPFFFLFNTGLLMQGSLGQILWDTGMGAATVLCACVFLHGAIGVRRRRPRVDRPPRPVARRCRARRRAALCLAASPNHLRTRSRTRDLRTHIHVSQFSLRPHRSVSHHHGRRQGHRQGLCA
jgi:TRAP-type uncharacterized transport system fused permease subunit